VMIATENGSLFSTDMMRSVAGIFQPAQKDSVSKLCCPADKFPTSGEITIERKGKPKPIHGRRTLRYNLTAFVAVVSVQM
jgi:hypothetical protein